MDLQVGWGEVRLKHKKKVTRMEVAARTNSFPGTEADTLGPGFLFVQPGAG